jgi:hypothetical protein
MIYFKDLLSLCQIAFQIRNVAQWLSACLLCGGEFDPIHKELLLYLLKNQLDIFIWMYFWVSYSTTAIHVSIPLSVPHSLDYCSILLLFPKKFSSSDSLTFHMNFRIMLFLQKFLL